MGQVFKKKNVAIQTTSKVNNFINYLDDLFDVAHAETMNLIELRENNEL